MSIIKINEKMNGILLETAIKSILLILNRIIVGDKRDEGM